MDQPLLLLLYCACVMFCYLLAVFIVFRQELFLWIKNAIVKREKIIYGCEARGDAHEPYLTRFILFYKPWLKIYFHNFHRSDAIDLHDHPWHFVSIILWRGYYEETYQSRSYQVRRRKRIWPGMIIYRRASHAHRVVLLNGKPAYTLVFVFKYVRHWGFITPTGWQHWSKYFEKKGC